jgi:hypothetical protein
MEDALGIGLWDVLAGLDGSALMAAVEQAPAEAGDSSGTSTPIKPLSPDKNEPSTPVKRPADDMDLDANMDPAEAKRVKRMRRNRESAAMSRERKKQYIEELETKLAALTSTVQQLRAENEALRAGRTPLEGAAPSPVDTDEDSLESLPPLVPQHDDSSSDTASLDAFLDDPTDSMTSMTLAGEPTVFAADFEKVKSNPEAAYMKIPIEGGEDKLMAKHAGRVGG